MVSSVHKNKSLFGAEHTLIIFSLVTAEDRHWDATDNSTTLPRDDDDVMHTELGSQRKVGIPSL